MRRIYDALPAFTASLNGLPALNVAAVEAEISRLSPVLGLRPVRAGRLLVPKVPKPAIRTSSPLARASAIASNTASTASPAVHLPTKARPRHPAGDIRFVHLFSPCIVVFSGRPARPIGGNRGRRPRLARNPHLFDPGNAVPSLSCLGAVCGVSHSRVSPRSSRRSRPAASGRFARGCGAVPRAAAAETDPCSTLLLTRWVHAAHDPGKCRRGGPSHGAAVSSLGVRGGERRRGPGEGRAPGGGWPRRFPPFRRPPMTDPDTVSADYTLRPSELAATLALLVEARQPTILWGAPGCAKSALAQQTAAGAARRYVDVRALLLDPVDLRGIPWRDADGRTRWAPPAFLPPAGDPDRWLINLEELPSPCRWCRPHSTSSCSTARWANTSCRKAPR